MRSMKVCIYIDDRPTNDGTTDDRPLISKISNGHIFAELTPERSTHWISGAWGGSLVYAGTTAFPTAKCGA